MSKEKTYEELLKRMKEKALQYYDNFRCTHGMEQLENASMTMAASFEGIYCILSEFDEVDDVDVEMKKISEKWNAINEKKE